MALRMRLYIYSLMSQTHAYVISSCTCYYAHHEHAIMYIILMCQSRSNFVPSMKMRELGRVVGQKDISLGRESESDYHIHACT